MKFFLDTANLDQLRKGVSWGIVDGITTNPTLIAKEGKPFEEHIREICHVMRRSRCPRRFHDDLRLVSQIPDR